MFWQYQPLLQWLFGSLGLIDIKEIAMLEITMKIAAVAGLMLVSPLACMLVFNGLKSLILWLFSLYDK